MVKMKEIAINTKNLTRDFGDIKAVGDLTLEIPKGIVFGLLGPNGSGKTTIIRLLLGLIRPSAGNAEVLGMDTRTQSSMIRENAGALLEHNGLYERLSAEENLMFYGRINHLSENDCQKRIKELLSNLGLWERRNESVGSWSRGMKQKVAIARALIHHPSIIFLDEPTAGLDPIAQAEFREDLSALVAHEGVTVLLTTHNLNEAEKLCGLVGVIQQGKLLALDHPDTLRINVGGSQVKIVGEGFSEDVLNSLRSGLGVNSIKKQNGYVLINLKQGADMSPMINYMINAGVKVDEVVRGKASLEDVYLSMMEEEE